ncbi:MAG: protein kinase [Chloroflexota bacterium]
MTLGQPILGGRYRLIERIGHGGMALVYQATDLTLERTVAIKVLRETLRDDAELVERFRREGRAAASLSHPNIVAVHDVGVDGPTAFIVMEFISGSDLKQIIRLEAPLPNARIAHLGSQIADGLAHAHARGIVHRDVKPQNVFVGRGDEAKIGDFGIAVALGARSITQTGAVIGSPHYMSPEQAAGEAAQPATDVYSLGVVLYEMATGRLPFQADSPLAVARMQETATARPARELNPALGERMAAVIERSMRKRAEERYPDGAELAAALRAAGGNGAPGPNGAAVPNAPTVVIPSVEGPTRVVAPSPAQVEPTRPLRRAERPRERPGRSPARVRTRSGAARAVVGGLAILGVAGGIALWVFSPTGGASSPRPTTAPVVVATAAQTATSRPVSTALPAAAVPSPALAATAGSPPPIATVAPTRPATAPALLPLPTAGPSTRAAPTPTPRPVTPTPRPPDQKPTAPSKPVQAGVRVPNVEGMDQGEARRALESAGFSVAVEEQTAPDRKGQVINQRPGAGDTVAPGSRITITLGS